MSRSDYDKLQSNDILYFEKELGNHGFTWAYMYDGSHIGYIGTIKEGIEKFDGFIKISRNTAIRLSEIEAIDDRKRTLKLKVSEKVFKISRRRIADLV